MLDQLKEAEKLLQPLVARAEAYKAQGGRKAGTLLSKVRNACLRTQEAINTVNSVTEEAATLGASNPIDVLRDAPVPTSKGK